VLVLTGAGCPWRRAARVSNAAWVVVSNMLTLR
jgi:hypothetical protein